MVQRIRIRGHVIRLFGVTPSTSRSVPQRCPTCENFYNDAENRKTVFLCCGYINCLDCNLDNNGKFACPQFIEMTGKRKPKKDLVRDLMNNEWLVERGQMSSVEGSGATKDQQESTSQSQIISDGDDGDQTCKKEDDDGSLFACPELVNQIKLEPMDEEGEFLEMPKLDAQVPVKTDFAELELSKHVEFLKCDRDIKIKVEMWIPKHHLKPVVLLERTSWVGGELKIRTKRKYSKRYRGTPTRRSERAPKDRGLIFF